MTLFELANPWMQGLIGAACGIFVLDMITMLVQSRSMAPLKTIPKTSPHITTSTRNSSSATTPLPLNPPTKVAVEILKEQANQKIDVPVGQLFKIKLNHAYSTGHNPWEMSACPSFLILNETTKITDAPYRQGMVGNGSWHVFVFQANSKGRGNIIMKMPCDFNQTRDVTLSFPIEVV